MKSWKRTLGICALMLVCNMGFAQNGDVVSGVKHVIRYFNQRPTQKNAILSTGECAAGIAFSANPATAAMVGLPVLAVGNGAGYLLRNSHPKIAARLQNVSGAFCLGYGLTRAGRAARIKPVKVKPPVTAPKPPAPTPTPNPTPTPGPAPNPTPNPVPPPNPTPPPSPTPNPPPVPKPPKGCIQDCGFPGNGGVNGGSDTNKPPFPGKGTTKGALILDNGVWVNS